MSQRHERIPRAARFSVRGQSRRRAATMEAVTKIPETSSTYQAIRSRLSLRAPLARTGSGSASVSARALRLCTIEPGMPDRRASCKASSACAQCLAYSDATQQSGVDAVRKICRGDPGVSVDPGHFRCARVRLDSIGVVARRQRTHRPQAPAIHLDPRSLGRGLLMTLGFYCLLAQFHCHGVVAIAVKGKVCGHHQHPRVSGSFGSISKLEHAVHGLRKDRPDRRGTLAVAIGMVGHELDGQCAIVRLECSVERQPNVVAIQIEPFCPRKLLGSIGALGGSRQQCGVEPTVRGQQFLGLAQLGNRSSPYWRMVSSRR